MGAKRRRRRRRRRRLWICTTFSLTAVDICPHYEVVEDMQCEFDAHAVCCAANMRDEIGQGSESTIYRARWRGVAVAYKRFKGVRQAEAKELVAAGKLLREAEILTQLRHPNVVQMYGAVTHPTNALGIVMELMDSSLGEYVEKAAGELPRGEQLNLSLDLARGLAYMHSFRSPVIHRDLRPSNVLVKRVGGVVIAKLGDFGLAKEHEGPRQAYRGSFEAQQFNWMAPESLHRDEVGLRDGIYSERTDCYALGACIWQIATRCIPFVHLYDPRKLLNPSAFLKLMEETFQKGRAAKSSSTVRLLPKLSDSVAIGDAYLGELVAKLMHVQPEWRETAKGAVALLEEWLEDLNDSDEGD